jgi:arylsulfatase A-like enzyme
MKPARFILGVLILAPLAGLHASEIKAARPNVVVIITDDQGYGDFACHGNPFYCPAKHKRPYQHLDADTAGFFGMIANLDENFAKLDATLAEIGLRDDTILIFMTDNGGTGGIRVFNAGLRGAKASLYEGGHRAACRRPKAAEPRRQNRHLRGPSARRISPAPNVVLRQPRPGNLRCVFRRSIASVKQRRDP